MEQWEFLLDNSPEGFRPPNEPNEQATSPSQSVSQPDVGTKERPADRKDGFHAEALGQTDVRLLAAFGF